MATPYVAWALGFNFRESEGFVTDGDDEVPVLGDIYPESGAGITYGWDNTVLVDDNDDTVDQRLAGDNSRGNNTGLRTFRVDLPLTGLYRIRAAFGAIGKTSNNFVRFQDGGETFKTISDASTSGTSEFTDANGTRHASATAWLSDNAAIEHTFTSTLFEMEITDPNQETGNSTRIAHLSLERVVDEDTATGLPSRKFIVRPCVRPVMYPCVWPCVGG